MNVRSLSSFFCAVIAIPIHGLSFLGFWTGRGIFPLPETPPAHKLAWEHDRSVWHNMKNQLTEWTRQNPKWFSKFLACIITLEGIALCLTTLL